MTNEKKRCGNCVYGGVVRDEQGVLRCYLHPPVVVQVTHDTVPQWKRPPVKSDDFCGSWADKIARSTPGSEPC
ncbi:MAG: hypothetical protein ACXAC5_02405 [Promethearchaeota archaeon]|jgi:hypothetical protein